MIGFENDWACGPCAAGVLRTQDEVVLEVHDEAGGVGGAGAGGLEGLDLQHADVDDGIHLRAIWAGDMSMG